TAARRDRTQELAVRRKPKRRPDRRDPIQRDIHVSSSSSGRLRIRARSAPAAGPRSGAIARGLACLAPRRWRPPPAPDSSATAAAPSVSVSPLIPPPPPLAPPAPPTVRPPSRAPTHFTERTRCLCGKPSPSEQQGKESAPTE